jgi:hypothetical protein
MKYHSVIDDVIGFNLGSTDSREASEMAISANKKNRKLKKVKQIDDN